MLISQIPELQDRVLLCHCAAEEECHADVMIKLFDEHFCARRDEEELPPEAEELVRAAANHEHVREDEPGTEPDEDAAPAGSGWCGRGPPLEVGQGPKARGLCSPGRWAPQDRNLPDGPAIQEIRKALLAFASDKVSSHLFAQLAAGRVSKSPFSEEDARELREKLFRILGIHVLSSG